MWTLAAIVRQSLEHRRHVEGVMIRFEPHMDLAHSAS